MADSTLFDPYGNPIPREMIARLRETEAGPTLAGVRPTISGSPADGLSPRRLAAIHRAAAEGDTLAAMELAEDIEERDAHYMGVLGTRRRQVAQLPMLVEPASEDPEHIAHADLVRAWVEDGPLEETLFDVLDSIGKGFSVHEIMWENGPDGILPRALAYRSPRWFEVSRADGETVMLRDLPAAGAPPGGILVQSGAPGSPMVAYPGDIGLTPLLPLKFLVHRSKAKSGILPRAGLARIASWAWMYKAFTLRDWALFVQNYGMPIRIGKYGPQSTEQERDVLWSAVGNLAGDCAAIIPQSMTIEFVKAESQVAAAELYERRADWLDRQVSKAVLGQTTTTDAISGGHAVGREHRLVQEDIERADAKALARSISRQIIAPMISLNFPGYIAAGGRRFPRLTIGRPDEVPIDEVVKALQWMGPQGLTVPARQVRERLNFDEPEADEDVVGGNPPPPPTPAVSPPHLSSKAEPGRGPGPAPGRTDAETVALQSMMASLRQRTVQPATVDPELLDRLQQRVELDAQGALSGLTDQVRAAVEAASDLVDLQARLDTLQLDPAEFAAAMQRGLAVAHLVGQAALLDEIRGAS